MTWFILTSEKECVLIELSKEERRCTYNMNCFVLKLLVNACSKSMIRSLSRWKLIQSSSWKDCLSQRMSTIKKILWWENVNESSCCAIWEWFFCSQNFVKVFIKTIRLNFKKSKAKESHSARSKKYSQSNYSNAINLTNKVVFNKDLKFINVSCADVIMKKIFIDINLNLRAVKYKKTKLIKFNSVEVVEITKRFKKLTQIIKEQSNSMNVIKQILNTFIEIRLRKLFDISFELFRQIFRSIIDEKIKTILKKRKIIAQSKDIKKESARWFNEI